MSVGSVGLRLGVLGEHRDAACPARPESEDCIERLDQRRALVRPESSGLVDVEPVQLKELDQRFVGRRMDVTDVLIGVVDRERPDGSFTCQLDVPWLMAGQEGESVDPAAEVRGGEPEVAVGGEDPRRLLEAVVVEAEVFDEAEGNDQVDRVGVHREVVVVQIARGRLQAVRCRPLEERLVEVDANDGVGVEVVAQGGGKRSEPTAEVEDGVDIVAMTVELVELGRNPVERLERGVLLEDVGVEK